MNPYILFKIHFVVNVCLPSPEEKLMFEEQDIFKVVESSDSSSMENKWIYQCMCLIEYHTNLKNDKLGRPIK